jgi:acyl-CoA synthetase (AMP-forming)/AMP-acid ligase II
MSRAPSLPPGIDAWPRGLWTMGRQLMLNARRFPAKAALADGRRALGYRALNASVNGLAHALLARGVAKGDHVALLYGNTIEHVIALYAAAKIGAPAVVLDAKWIAREIAQGLALFDCGFLIYDRAHEAQLPDKLPPRLAFDERDAAWLAAQPADEPAVEVADDDVFLIMLTSGTTGLPKGCVKTHLSYAHSNALAAASQHIDEQSRELIVVPIYYNSGRVSLVNLISLGGTVHLRERLDPEEALATIERERITSIALAPTQCNELLAFPRLDAFDKSSLRSLRKAGLPFPARAVQEIMERICPHLYQGFGGTEFSSAALLRPEEQLTKLGSAGRPLAGMEVEIVDDERRPLPPMERGEVRVRGPSVCSGYYKNEAANRVTFIDGWYYSGDLGYLDEEGYLYIAGRKKDLVKTGGINVAPREVEDAILSLPEVADAAVVGVADQRWGEMLKALVVLKPGASLTPERIRERCGERLARYKIPKAIEFVAQIPRSPLGKVTAEVKAALDATSRP